MVAFGRIPEFDPRSLNFPIRSLLGPVRAPQTSFWDCYAALDQGNEGACVGFAWAHELAAEPEIVPNVTDNLALQFYHRAQQLDEWFGEDYEGTSVLAGAKTVTEAGHLLEYRWSFSLADLLETVSYFGPVVLGINWYSGMVSPDANGDVHVTGSIVGGHAILCYGVNTTLETVRLRNSWGRDWGDRGDCWLSWGELERLLNEDGECCVPVLRVHVGDNPPTPEPVDPIDPVEPVEPVEPVNEGCLPRFLRGFTQKRR